MALILSGAIAIVWSGCVLDQSERCGPNQMIYPDAQTERCVCVPNAVYAATGCTLCGENEVPGATSCVCAPGFTRGAEGACVEASSALGAACSTSLPCADATFNHCATSANGDGYCTTTGCTDSAQCTGGYACDLTAATPYCKRPPVGAGMSCTSNTDCAGTEATFCDTFMEHACLVQGCAVSPNSCFSGRECCDLSAFGIPMPICIPAGACVK